jgi:hypothetical protein
MNHETEISQQLAKLVEALVDSGELRAWFFALQKLSPAQREAHLLTMAERMKAGGEEPGLISAVTYLSRPQIYDGVRQTLCEVTGK